MMITRRGRLTALAAFGGLALAACSSSPTSAPPAGGGGAHSVVTIHTLSGGGKVLAAGDGHTLYMSNQEKSGKLMCRSSACTTIWMPLTVPTGQHLRVPSGVMGTLSTVTRPDGSKQVTLNRAPLYTFALDHAAGQANGNDAHDSFDGVHFTWHAVTVSGAAAPGPSRSSGNGGGYGGGYAGGY